jgi:hypothetical protein
MVTQENNYDLVRGDREDRGVFMTNNQRIPVKNILTYILQQRRTPLSVQYGGY